MLREQWGRAKVGEHRAECLGNRGGWGRLAGFSGLGMRRVCLEKEEESR